MVYPAVASAYLNNMKHDNILLNQMKNERETEWKSLPLRNLRVGKRNIYKN
jgi:hypothetical protein